MVVFVLLMYKSQKQPHKLFINLGDFRMKGNIKKLTEHNPNVICDTCGRKRKWSEVTHSYGSGDIPVVISCLDGCADVRHPLNSPPPIIFDGQPVPDARPDQDITYLATSPQTWDSNGYVWGSAPDPFSFDPPINDDVNWEDS